MGSLKTAGQCDEVGSRTGTSASDFAERGGNGMSGNPIQVGTGGDYTVYFTDTLGCTSKANRMMPRDPNSYFWIFPKGCYTLCEPDGPFNLVGPLAVFPEWSWNYNQHSDLAGGNTLVQPYTLHQSGIYNLALNNGLCQAVSDDMDFTILSEGCKKQIVACNIDLKVIKSYGRIVDERCQWLFDMDFHNNQSNPVAYSIAASVGSAVPASGVLVTGYSNENFRLNLPSGYSGGTVTLTFTFYLTTGEICIREVDLKVTPCQKGMPFYRMAPTSENDIAPTDVSNLPILMLAPNPASGTVLVAYNASVSGNVEVYDVLGRKVAAQAVAKGSGSWQLDVSTYTPGLYRVVLREGGQIIRYETLSVRH